MAIVAAASAIVSCSINEQDVKVPEEGFRYSFILDDAETRATLDNGGVLWETGDRVGMYLDGYTGYANIDVDASPKTVTLYSRNAIPANSYAYAYYPYAGDNNDKTKNKVVISNVQQGGGTSAMPMAGIPFLIEDEVTIPEGASSTSTSGVIKFLNLGSIIDFKIYSDEYSGETVQYVTFKTDGAAVSGDAYIDLTGVDANDVASLALNFLGENDYDYVKVNQEAEVTDSKDDATSIYMVVAPGTYSGTITIGTDVATYTFTFSNKTLARNGLKHYNMNLNNATRVEEVVETVKSLPYSEPFTSNQGEFSIENIALPEGQSSLWSFNSSYGAKVTAYISNTNYASETWLVSPQIDLTSVAAAEITFDQCVNKFMGKDDGTLWIKKVGDENYTQVANTYPTVNGTWSSFEETTIDLADYVGEKIVFAFKYVSTTTSAGTWEIKNFSVAEKIYTTEFSMDAASISVEAGRTKSNNVTVNSGAAITYSSEDENIATVDQDGKVTGVAEGTTTINVHADANGNYPSGDDSFEVTVTPAVSYSSFTWDLSTDQTVSASADALNWNYRGVTMVAAKGSSTTAANNYYPGTSGKSYTSTRFYTNSTLTITPYTGSSIGYVEFVATSTSYASALGSSSSTWTNATASVDDKTVTVEPTTKTDAFSATISATCGFTSVTVYYTGDLEALVPTVSVETAEASNTVSEDGDQATLNGTITLVNDAEWADVSEVGFKYKKGSESYTTVTVTVPSSGTSAEISTDLTDLTPDAEYTYYAYVVYDGNTIEDEDGAQTFTPTKTPSTFSYTLTATNTYSNISNTAYAQTYDVTIDGITWNAPGNQNFSGYWRIGGKSLTNVARVIYGKTGLSGNVDEIVINTNGVSNTNLTVSSITVTAHSTAALAASETDASQISFTTEDNFTFSKSTAKSLTFTKSGDTDLTGYFYRIVFTVSNSTSTNYGLDLTSIVFSETED